MVRTSSCLSRVLSGGWVDDITNIELSVGSKIVLYADDILLYHPINTNSDYTVLQADIDSLKKLGCSQCYDIITKCKHMTRSRKGNNPALLLSLNGCILDNVTTFKYLGVLSCVHMDT